MGAGDDERGREPADGSGADDGAMPAALTVGQAAAWIGRSPGGLRLAIARGLLRAEQHVSPLQPRPYWLIERADLLDYEERMAERGAKRGPKPQRRIGGDASPRPRPRRPDPRNDVTAAGPPPRELRCSRPGASPGARPAGAGV